MKDLVKRHCRLRFWRIDGLILDGLALVGRGKVSVKQVHRGWRKGS